MLLIGSSNWQWPTIDGLDKFQGTLMHSARWDDSYDFTGKKVACIGIGSSAIQIVPNLAKGMDFSADTTEPAS
jgi:cation diffusion facilitator CzcD-associated flavoprotein CzcO